MKIYAYFTHDSAMNHAVNFSIIAVDVTFRICFITHRL